jgi:hypothetical protein
VKRFEYVPIDDDKINLGIVIGQAVQSLDLAGMIAADSKDIDSLFKLSDHWMNFGSQLVEILDDQDDDDEPADQIKEAKQYGFSNTNKTITEKAEVDIDGPDED